MVRRSRLIHYSLKFGHLICFKRLKVRRFGMKFPTITKFFSITSLLLSAATTSIAQDVVKEPAEAKTDFIRVDHTEANAILQTGITRYTKGDTVVDLIGAVHIADKSYYDQLNKEFTNYEVLLFEMVGGEAIKEQLKADKKQPAKKKDLQLDFLSGMYSTMTKKLDLTGQKDGIDYTKDNFVHADLSIKEFNDLQKKKGESLLKFAFQNAMEQAKQQAHSPIRQHARHLCSRSVLCCGLICRGGRGWPPWQAP